MTSSDQQNELRAYIRAVLSEKGWDVPELARRADTSSSTLYNFLSGNKRAGHNLLNRLAVALEVPPEKLHRLGGLLPNETITEEDELWEELRAAFDDLDNYADKIAAIRLVWTLGKTRREIVGGSTESRNPESQTARRRRPAAT